MRIELPYNPRAWQRKCHVSRRRFTVLVLHRRAGKTELAIRELVDKALKCGLDLPLFAYIAPELKQAKAVAWRRLKAILDSLIRAGLAEVRESELSVTFKHNGAKIQLYGADNPDAMRGLRLDGVVLDEVAQMAPEVWHSIVQPALADRLGWAIFIGTVQGVDLFSELYFKGLEEQKRGESWFCGLWTCYDTDALDPVEIARLQRTMPPNEFAREMLCDFGAAGANQLISLNDVEVAAHRVYTPADLVGTPVILGVDPARFGDDRSVIARRQGLQAFEPVVIPGIDNMTLASRVALEIEQHHPDAVFIDQGAGTGVIDRLRQLGHEITEVPFGARALLATLYVNRRTEMWCKMAEWLRAGGAIPNMRAMKQELATPTYKFDNSERRALEAKDEIKKRLPESGSPDLADALALTFAAPVLPKVRTFAEDGRVRHVRRQGVPRNPYLTYRR